MRNSHCSNWNMARKITNEENERLTWQDMKYGEKKTEKRGKLDTNNVGPGVRQETLKKLEKEKCTLYTWNKAKTLINVQNEKKNFVGHGIIRETLKNLKNEKETLQNLEYGETH